MEASLKPGDLLNATVFRLQRAMLQSEAESLLFEMQRTATDERLLAMANNANVVAASVADNREERLASERTIAQLQQELHKTKQEVASLKDRLAEQTKKSELELHQQEMRHQRLLISEQQRVKELRAELRSSKARAAGYGEQLLQIRDGGSSTPRLQQLCSSPTISSANHQSSPQLLLQPSSPTKASTSTEQSLSENVLLLTRERDEAVRLWRKVAEENEMLRQLQRSAPRDTSAASVGANNGTVGEDWGSFASASSTAAGSPTNQRRSKSFDTGGSPNGSMAGSFRHAAAEQAATAATPRNSKPQQQASGASPSGASSDWSPSGFRDVAPSPSATRVPSALSRTPAGVVPSRSVSAEPGYRSPTHNIIAGEVPSCQGWLHVCMDDVAGRWRRIYLTLSNDGALTLRGTKVRDGAVEPAGVVSQVRLVRSNNGSSDDGVGQDMQAFGQLSSVARRLLAVERVSFAETRAPHSKLSPPSAAQKSFGFSLTLNAPLDGSEGSMLRRGDVLWCCGNNQRDVTEWMRSLSVWAEERPAQRSRFSLRGK